MDRKVGDYQIDNFHDECGVFGIIGTPDASAHTALGLHALQHRGQEAAGIVSWDNQKFHMHRGLGHVDKNFGGSSSKVLAKLKGHSAIGHNRYSTTGETNLENVQPLFANLDTGGLAICHNGNLTNALELRQSLIKEGCIFQSTTDTEPIIHLISQSTKPSFPESLVEAIGKIKGGFSLVCLAQETDWPYRGTSLIGIRDPLGIRPLVLGKLGDAHILASETCAFDIIGAEFVRDINPGEMIVLSPNRIQSVSLIQRLNLGTYYFLEKESRFCIFEYIYFARPDSVVQGRSVYNVRKAIGSELANENPVDADIVVPVPDSGVPAAIGYAETSNIPFELGIIRNHYVGRTFIEPVDQVRHLGVKLKHNANKSLIQNKRIILIDDSIVRGTTSKKIVEMIRNAGAKEVHMRVASPPNTNSCFYGVDTPEREKLIAARLSVSEMEKEIGVDSLAFVSIDGLYRAMGEEGRDSNKPKFCDACLTGQYPVKLFL